MYVRYPPFLQGTQVHYREDAKRLKNDGDYQAGQVKSLENEFAHVKFNPIWLTIALDLLVRAEYRTLDVWSYRTLQSLQKHKGYLRSNFWTFGRAQSRQIKGSFISNQSEVLVLLLGSREGRLQIKGKIRTILSVCGSGPCQRC
jgi:hypothetical protein